MKKLLAVIVVVVVVIVGWVLFQNNGSVSPSPSTSASPEMSTAPLGTVPPSSSPAAMASPTASAQPKASFSVSGNDVAGSPTTITVAKGTLVTIKFTADAQGTYHGGLDFRSSVVSTGPIAPGSSKTISFTAENSFSFTPYWPATNIAKPYTINIVVQ